jgi:acetyl esterase/lipase
MIPPWDPQLRAALDLARDAIPATVTADSIPALQASSAQTAEAALALEIEFGVQLQTHPVTDGVDVLVAHPRLIETSAPAIFFVHGGGMIMGSPLFGLDLVLPWGVSAGTVVVSPGYRLAPQHPDPTPANDCWAALQWTVAHADELGIDRDKIVVVGHSAGGGLAAGLALRARDEGGPHLLGQLLMCPMLDDREGTNSSRELDGDGVWDRTSNRTGWTALLGSRRGGTDVASYAAPARAENLGQLPSLYIDVGSNEIFRDEVVEYASRVWQAGGAAELHVWPGAYHCFEIVAPQADISRAALTARTAWFERLIHCATRNRVMLQ